MNYYSFDYSPPSSEDLSLDLQLVQDSKSEDLYTLQIGVTSPDLSNEDRAPMSLTFILDTSGSMSGTPFDMLKAVCREIAGKLREGDLVSVVTWSSDQDVPLSSYAVSGPDDPTLLSLFSSMSSGGGTDLSGGLERGYQLAELNHQEDRVSRVLLISDGANLGVTSGSSSVAWLL